MNVKRLIMTTILALCLSLLGSGMAAGQDIIDLVFCLDGSGSMDPPGWLAQIQGTAAAIAGVLPQDGTIRITVIQFGSNSQTELGPVIVTDSNVDDLADQVSMLPYLDAPSTNTASCIDLAVDELDGLMPPSTTQIIDVSTDGVPGNSSAAITAAENAIAAGIDQINALGVGLNASGQAFLDQLVLPQDGDEGDGFVVVADDFDHYLAAITEKVQREIGVCAHLDRYDASCATDASGVVNVTLTFTNFLTDENGVPFDAEHIWLTDPVLLNDPMAVVSIAPNYFSFQNDPICSAVDPACVNPTRTIMFTVFGAPDGGQLQFNLGPHDEDYEPCCEEVFTIELPDCDCGQVLSDNTYCVWSWPPWQANFFFNFTFQNLYSEVVEEIRLTPVAPPFPSIQFNPNIIGGLSLAPPPVAGTTNNTVQVLGPAAVSGQHVEFLISTHNEDGPCCSIRHEIDLPYHCFWKPIPEPWPPHSKEIFVQPLESGFEISGFGRSGHGVTLPADDAEGMIVSLTPSRFGAGAYLRLEASGMVNGQEAVLSGVTLADGGRELSIGVDSAIGLVGGVELFLEGGAVIGAGLDVATGVTLPAGAWPSGAAFQRRDGAIALAFPRAMAVSVAGQTLMADQVVFGVATQAAVDALTGVTITGDGIDALTVEAQVYPIQRLE